MPNHVANEITFNNVSPAQFESIKACVLNSQMEIDFEVLLPIPLNYWQGSVGIEHSNAFPGNALGWCSENWGTKWGPYDKPTIEYDGTNAVLRFSTAWNTPRGWLCALFNKLKMSFRVLWLSEGENSSRVEIFDWPAMESKCFAQPWRRVDSTPEEHDRIGRQLWGEAWDKIKKASE